MSGLSIIKRDAWNPEKRSCAPVRRGWTTLTEGFVHWPGLIPGSWQHVNSTAKERAAIRDIQQFHMHDPAHKWCDIGYNYVLTPNWGRPSASPRIYVARGPHWTPAAQLNHNEHTLAILVLMGPNDPLTPEVKAKLHQFARYVTDKVGHDLRWRPHRAVTPTECPGPALAGFVGQLNGI